MLNVKIEFLEQAFATVSPGIIIYLQNDTIPLYNFACTLEGIENDTKKICEMVQGGINEMLHMYKKENDNG